jgi:peptidoglycan/LPS O-acetylase OafA/YrhL
MVAVGMSNVTAAKAARPTFSIPSLDGIRTCSFMLVFLAHVGVPLIPGGFGVTVFFFLSGYLITTLLRREVETTGTVSLKSFYLRRVLRILPPFYLVLSVALGLTLLNLLPGPFYPPTLVAQALHYANFYVIWHGWTGLLAGTGVYWSLAVEEHFYLLFPALYLLMIRRGLSSRAQHALLLAACALVLAWRCWLVFGQGIIGDRTYIGSDTRFDSMLFGCALAVWNNPAIDVERTPRPSALELVAAASGVALLLASFLLRDPAFRESVRYTMQGVGLYPLFFLSVRHPTWFVMPFLNLRPIRFLGTLSYSLYLIHQVVIHLVWDLPWPVVARAALTLAISFGLALGIWRYVEKPCAKLRSRLSAGTGH